MVRLCTSIAGAAGAVPAQGAVMTLHDAGTSQKIKIKSNKNKALFCPS